MDAGKAETSLDWQESLRREAVRQIIEGWWGRVPTQEVLARARKIDPHITLDSLNRRATALRKQGIPLPRYRPERHFGYSMWTAADTAYLEAHLGAQSVSQIATALGRSLDSVYCYLSRKGLSGRATPSTPPAPCQPATLSPTF